VIAFNQILCSLIKDPQLLIQKTFLDILTSIVPETLIGSTKTCYITFP